MSGPHSWLRRKRVRSSCSDAKVCGPAAWSAWLSLQHRVFGHRNDVLKVGLSVQEVEQIGVREAAVEANPDPCTGKAVGEHIDQTTQNPFCSYRSGHVAGAQHGCAQILFGFVIEAHKSHYRQVAPAVVVSVEER